MMDLDNSFDDNINTGGSDEDEVISMTRRNLLMAQLYDGGIEVQEDLKEDESNGFLSASDSLKLEESIESALNQVSNSTIQEIDDAFEKLRQWRSGHARDLQVQSDGDNSEADEASWARDMLNLANDVEMLNLSENQNDGRGNGSEILATRARTLQKLQSLMSNLEESRKRRDVSNNSDIFRDITSDPYSNRHFLDLLTRLENQNQRIARERVPLPFKPEALQHQTHLRTMSESKLATEGKDCKEDMYENTPNAERNVQLSSFDSKESDYSNTRLESLERTVFRDACREVRPETDEDKFAHFVDNGSFPGFMIGATIEERDRSRLRDSDRRRDELMEEELDLHCGLNQLGGQLADFMDDLENLFPDEAKNK